jgi:hypothetical protein
MQPIAFTQPPLVSGGNVSPKRFITLSTTAGKTGVQASAASQLLIGVSEAWTRYVPNSPADDGYHAIAGEGIGYRGPLQIATLTLGGSVTNPRTPLTADADGKGVAASTGNYVGAIALELGSSGEDIDVYVVPPFLAP